MAWAAKYDGTCARCLSRFPEGTPIQVSGDPTYPYEHAGPCPDPLAAEHPVCGDCFLVHPPGACDMTEPAPDPEPTETAPGALPRWYDPRRPLVACVDGPRSGAWYYADAFDAQEAGYRPSGANPIPHRLDPRVTAQPLIWAP